MSSDYNEHVYNTYGVSFRVGVQGDDAQFKENARKLAEENKKREEEQRKKEEQRRQTAVSFTASAARFNAPVEGLDFGDECEIQVSITASAQSTASPSILFKLTMECESRIEQMGQFTGTSDAGIAKVKVPLRQPSNWTPGKQVKFSFVAQCGESEAKSEAYLMPSKGTQQLFKFQIVADSCGCAGKNVNIRGQNGNDICKAFVPSYSTQNVDCISVRDNHVVEFYYPKPTNGQSFSISLQAGYETAYPLTLPDVFFRDNEPIYLLHTTLEGNSLASYMPGLGGGAGTSFASQSESFAPLLSPIQLGPDMTEDEPFIFIELKGNAAQAGLNEGVNVLDNVSDAGIKVLHETIHGNTIAPGAISVAEHRKILLDFCKNGRFYIKTIKGKSYVVFKGYAGLRRWYNGSKYLLDNAKVVSLSASSRGLGHAAKSAIKGSKGTFLAFVFVGALDVYEWMKEPEGERFFSDLLVQFASDAAQMIFSSIVGAIVAAALVGTAAVGISVLLAVGAGIVVSIFIGLIITAIDERLQLTEKAKAGTRNAIFSIQQAYEDNFVKPFSNFLYQLEQALIYQNPVAYRRF